MGKVRTGKTSHANKASHGVLLARQSSLPPIDPARLRWTWLSLAFLVLVACSTEVGGEDGNGINPDWDPPPPCSELYDKEFVAKGGDPRGTWLPLRECFMRQGEMMQTEGPPCPPVLRQKERLQHISEMTVRDGSCDFVLTEMTVIEEMFIAAECLPGPPLEACLYFETVHAPPLPGYYGDAVSAVCEYHEDEAACRCRHEYEWYPETSHGSIPCDIRLTSIAQYKDGPVEYEHSVEGDYLIRRLIRYPQSMPPKDDGTPRTRHYGFEIYRRAD